MHNNDDKTIAHSLSEFENRFKYNFKLKTHDSDNKVITCHINQQYFVGEYRRYRTY